ncbi:MAG: beta-propeller domain-containing protein [Methanobacteriota archaeon]
MTKTKQVQGLGLMLIGILIIASVAYIATLQPIGTGAITTYDVKNFESYRALTVYLQESQGNTGYYPTLGGNMLRDSDFALISEEASGAKSTDGGQAVDYSQTNVQVAGVDEPDIVKTDGTYLYIVSNNKVLIVKAYPAGEAVIEATITVNENLTIQNIFISGTRLVIFTQSYNHPILFNEVKTAGNEASIEVPWYYSPDTSIIMYDLSVITSPELVKEIVVPGSFSGARLIGDYIYLITTQYSYSNNDIGDDQSIIPRLLVDGVAVDIPLDDIYYVDIPEKSNTLTNIVSVNIQDDSEQIHNKIFLLGSSQTLYVSEENIYITYYTGWYYDYTILQTLVDEVLMPILPDSVKSQLDSVKTLDLEDYQKQEITYWILQNYVTNNMPEDQKTQITRELIRRTEQTIIHRISIHDGEITYESQGSIPGYINNQFSLDEYNGYLRVSTTVQGSSLSYLIGSIDPETNIYVLNMQLNITGSLEDITPETGESIYATRFIGDTCYLVTFRQTDPFFVIDLSDPTNPTILGELKIPGFSTYLHPYDVTHVIGIGRDSRNVKISLYDVTDMNNPVELANYTIVNPDENNWWWTNSVALYEHKAFLFDKEKNLLVIPAGNYSKESAYVFSISLENGLSLKGIITHDLEVQQQEPTYYWYDSGNTIQRSLYIGNILYTISENQVKMNDLDTLTEINSVALVQ